MGKVPKWMQAVVWSVDVDKLDLERDKNYIITQALNYGNTRTLEWLFGVYDNDTVTTVLMNPSRGAWYPKILNYWQKRFGLEIPRERYVKAIKSIIPNDWKNTLASN